MSNIRCTCKAIVYGMDPDWVPTETERHHCDCPWAGHDSISIVIPIHNAEKTVARAIQSVVDQTYAKKGGKLQVICVMNCCTDQSFTKVAHFAHGPSYNPSLRVDNVFFNVVNCYTRGIVPALNAGLSNAQHDWIARMDADDYWYPDKLERQMEHLAETGADICGTQIRLVHPETYLQKEISNYPLNDAEIKAAMFQARNPIAHPSVVFHKSILERTGTYTEMFPMAEDYFQWVKAARCGYTFTNLPNVLMDYTAVHNPNYDPKVPQLLAYIAGLMEQNITKR